MAIVISGNGIDMGNNPISNVDIQNNVDVVDKEYVDTGAGVAFVANDTRVKTALNASGTAPIYACRAWVNFDGTGTVAIRKSGNVSSITDLGTGRYRVNFATAMQDANYAFVASENTNTSVANHTVSFSMEAGTETTTSINTRVHFGGSSNLDWNYCLASIFR